MTDELRYSPGGIRTYIFQVLVMDWHFKFRRKFSSVSVALYNTKPLMFPYTNFPMSSRVVTCNWRLLDTI